MIETYNVYWVVYINDRVVAGPCYDIESAYEEISKHKFSSDKYKIMKQKLDLVLTYE